MIKQLTFEAADRRPNCIAGGKAPYSSQVNGRAVSREVSIDGGAPSDPGGLAYTDLVSPDGAMVLDEDAIRRRDSRAIVMPAPRSGYRAWSPDSRGIAYVDPERAAEVLYQPLAGGPPRTLTRFGLDAKVFSFAWSPDGRRLICARGNIVSDMLLIRDPK